MQTSEVVELVQNRCPAPDFQVADSIDSEGVSQALRVLIVAEHASQRFGGEAVLPLHYFRVLRQRGVETWLVVHERTREELMMAFPEDSDRIYFVPDTFWHKTLNSASRFLPRKVSEITFGSAMGWLTQIYQRRLIRELVKSQKVDVIHQPIYVSPKTPSLIFGMGVPVVMGPMNGGMTYPPGFQHMESRFVRFSVRLGRLSSNLLNTLIPGKKLAATLLVANQRTRKALPAGTRGQVVELVENGVDISLWQPQSSGVRQPENDSQLAQTDLNPALTRFVFVGRLVDWKGVDLLLLAFKQVLEKVPAVLEIIGDGAERTALAQLTRSLFPEQQGGSGATPSGSDHSGSEAVRFSGWLSPSDCAQRLQVSDVLVLPSLFESGGAVVLEAMAMGLPVIATDWGGPADYLNEHCGMLIDPASPASFVDDLAAAMVKLAQSPATREQMGQVGQQQVIARFDWERKVDKMLEIYAETVNREKTQRQGQLAIAPKP